MTRLDYAASRCAMGALLALMLSCAAPQAVTSDLADDTSEAAPTQPPAAAKHSGPAPESLTTLTQAAGPGPCKVTTQGEHREASEFRYSDTGHELEQRLDLDLDGRAEQTMTTDRDERGRPIKRVWRDGDGDDGAIVQTTTWRYDPQGREILQRVEGRALNREVRTTYGADGLPKLIETVQVPSGEVFMRVDIVRGDKSIKEQVDMDGDGKADEVRVTTLDAQGRPARIEQSGPAWALTQWRRLQYNDRGQLVRDTAGEGGATIGDRVTTHTYDAQGRRAHTQIDSDRDGQPNLTLTFDYSCHQ